jgi:gluconolactonase
MNVSILATGLKFPEGPVVTQQGNIYCVELLGGAITEYKREEKTLKRFDVGGAPNGMMVLDDDTLSFL